MPNKPAVNGANSDGLIKFDVRETGTIKSVRECIIRVKGLPSCINGQMVECSQGGEGMVMGFNEEEAHIMVFKSNVPLRAGGEVYSKGQFLNLPVGEKFLGRVVNPLCEPVDSLGPIEPDAFFRYSARRLRLWTGFRLKKPWRRGPCYWTRSSQLVRARGSF